MIYIPSSWFKDIKNEKSVHKLFEEYFPGDLVTQEHLEKQKTFTEKLRQIGEHGIAKRYEQGEIITN